jgi:uncharacterized protein
MCRELEGLTMFRRVLPVNLVLASLMFAACVTVNVYFPAAEAERAADRAIDVVKGESAGGAAQQPQRERGDSDTAALRAAPEVPILLAALGHALESLVPAAHAQSANIDISSPEVDAILASMAQRYQGELKKYFASGAIGWAANGDVAVRDQNAVPITERATVKRLVAEENGDRASLYAAIAKANGHPEWESDIRQTFARRWIERAASGEYYQDTGGNWAQK